MKKVFESAEFATFGTDELSFGEAGLAAGMVLDTVSVILSKISEGASKSTRYEKIEVAERYQKGRFGR